MPRAHLNMKANKRTASPNPKPKIPIPVSRIRVGGKDLKDEDILHLLQLCVNGPRGCGGCEIEVKLKPFANSC